MSGAQKYRKRPVVIEALQWLGTNKQEMIDFTRLSIESQDVGFSSSDIEPDTVQIATREGVMTGNRGDWIIKGVDGGFYPCKPEIFELTYEKADPE